RDTSKFLDHFSRHTVMAQYFGEDFHRRLDLFGHDHVGAERIQPRHVAHVAYARHDVHVGIDAPRQGHRARRAGWIRDRYHEHARLRKVGLAQRRFLGRVAVKDGHATGTLLVHDLEIDFNGVVWDITELGGVTHHGADDTIARDHDVIDEL